MPSKLVVSRQKIAAAVIASGNTHAALVAQKLAELMAPHLKKGEKAPDFGLVVRLMMRVLTNSSQTMVSADEANEAELLDDDPPRRARDEEATRLNDRLVQLREGLGGLYGAEVLVDAGFSSATPADPMMLCRFAGEVAAALEKVKLPAPRWKGAAIDVKDEAHQIMQSKRLLEKHLADVQREEREAEATLTAKTRAITAHDDHVAGSIDTLSGLLRMSGERELAERVRPPRRHVAKDDGANESTPPADKAADPAPTEEKTDAAPAEKAAEPPVADKTAA